MVLPDSISMAQWYTELRHSNDILRFRVMTYQQYIAGAWQAMETMIANGDAAALPTKERMKAMHEQLPIRRWERCGCWKRDTMTGARLFWEAGRQP